MRMKKRLMALVLAVLAAFALSGCTKMELTEYISKKGSYSSTMREYIEKEAMVEIVGRKIGSDYMKDIERDLKDQGWTFRTIKGKEYYVSKPVRESYSSLDKLYENNQREAVGGKWQVWETGLHVDMKELLGCDNWVSVVLGEDPGELEDKDLVELQRRLAKSYFTYSVTFAYDIKRANAGGKIDSGNPKKVTWNIPMSGKPPVLDVRCKSGITVRGVTQGETYGKNKKVRFKGVSSAKYKGKKIKSGAVFKKHGQHTLFLKAKNGERRTVSFFIDKKKPEIKGVRDGKTYHRNRVYFRAKDADCGIAWVKINGKKKKRPDYWWYTVHDEGANRIVVMDNAGNKTKLRFTLVKKSHS